MTPKSICPPSAFSTFPPFLPDFFLFPPWFPAFLPFFLILLLVFPQFFLLYFPLGFPFFLVFLLFSPYCCFSFPPFFPLLFTFSSCSPLVLPIFTHILPRVSPISPHFPQFPTCNSHLRGPGQAQVLEARRVNVVNWRGGGAGLDPTAFLGGTGCHLGSHRARQGSGGSGGTHKNGSSQQVWHRHGQETLAERNVRRC